MPEKINHIHIMLTICLFLISGCSSYNSEEIRQKHAENYPLQLAQKTREILDGNEPLNLDDCIRISMDNSLAIKENEIKQRLALLEKKVSFANFLPAVSLNYDKKWFDPQPMIQFGSTGIPMQDKDVREITWNIQLSIFNPATWCMYALHTHGYEISKLVTEYTRQSIALQITAQYFQCLSLEKMLIVTESQLNAAKAVQRELKALGVEGIANDWKVEQANSLVLTRQTELQRTKNSHKQAKAELMANMGLNPLEDVSLETQLNLEVPEGSLEDLITEALLNHPSMSISDREAAVEKEKIRAAVTAFIPNLYGYAARIDTSDSHQVFTNYWLGGISAAITLFDGLANVNYYKAAKELRQASLLRRDQAAITLMIQVIRASDQVQTAKDLVELTEQIEKTSAIHLAEIKKQYEQGLIQTSDMLMMTAEAQNAEVQSLQARFQYQTCIAMLNNVMGHTKTKFEDSNNDTK
ncbi:MAG: TolC family protein [Sedimentisphaerales bacterium]|nr:TolC family protein [Sedimentisphaerales bacterium]